MPSHGLLTASEGVVKIPEELRIPAFVFGLQAVMMAGWILIFWLMLPEGH